MYPLGNGDAALDQLSLFLGVADAKKLPPGWAKLARFRLQIINHLNPAKTISKGSPSSSPSLISFLILSFLIFSVSPRLFISRLQLTNTIPRGDTQIQHHKQRLWVAELCGPQHSP